MYRAEEKREAIFEIQEFLSAVYESEDLYKSGVYDEKTAELIIHFQEKKNIPRTGRVDYITHQELYNSYKKSKQKSVIGTESNLTVNFPIDEGTFHEDMIKINKELSELLARYRVHNSVRIRPHYSRGTADGVRALRRIMMLPDGNTIDEELYYRMTSDLKNNQ